MPVETCPAAQELAETNCPDMQALLARDRHFMNDVPSRKQVDK
jgi:hypothetical protein